MKFRFAKGRFAWIVAPLLLAGCGGGSGVGSGSGTPAATGRIAFVSTADGNPEIYVIDDNGQNRRRLTSSAASDTYPALSRDGRRIAWLSRSQDPTQSGIYIMNVDGTGKRQLTNDSRDLNPAISPDGGKVAFISTRSGPFELYSVSSDGGTPRQLTTDSNALFFPPAFSPDGQTLAFSAIARTGANGIYSVGISGGTSRLLVSAPKAASVTSTPAGQIVFATRETQTTGKLFLVNADGTGLKDISDGKNGGIVVAASPDGTRIAFDALDRAGPTDSAGDIVIRPLQSGTETVLTKGGLPSWGRISS